ncbi:MAG: prepilin peptidase [Gemmatimonadota bacterium]
MIPELHALAFLAFLLAAAWQDATTRSVSAPLVYTGLAVSLSLRALLGADVHMEGLLGLLAGLVVALVLLALHAAQGSDLRLLLMVGAFLGARGTLTAVLVATGVMLLAAAAGALLHRGPWRGTRAARVLATPYSGVGWSEGRVVLTGAAEAAVAKAAPVSPGMAIVLGAVAGWIL